MIPSLNLTSNSKATTRAASAFSGAGFEVNQGGSSKPPAWFIVGAVLLAVLAMRKGWK